MSQFEIRSTDGAILRFGDIRRLPEDNGHRMGDLTVTLVSKPISAVCRVAYAELAGWSRFFADLAEDWRGWEGQKRWKEFELELSGTADGKGDVALRVVLQDREGRVWRAETLMRVEAGQLEDMAKAAADYFG